MVKVTAVAWRLVSASLFLCLPALAEVKIIIPFTDPVIVGGKFVYHCHILSHEDHGMMAIAQVYKPK